MLRVVYIGLELFSGGALVCFFMPCFLFMLEMQYFYFNVILAAIVKAPYFRG